MAFEIEGDGILRYQGRLCVLDNGLGEKILTEAHKSQYIVHPSLTKMYHDLKEIYVWNNMKRDVENFVAKCMVCQHVQVKHLRSGSISQDIELPVWK